MNLIQYTIKDSNEMETIIILDRCYLDLEEKGLNYNSIRGLIEKEKDALFHKVNNEINFECYLRRIEGIYHLAAMDMTEEEKEDFRVAFEDYLDNEIEEIYRCK